MKLLLATRRRRYAGAPSEAGSSGEVQTKFYTVDTSTDIANPERGWYVENAADYSFTSGENNPAPVNSIAPAPTLQMRFVDLRNHRTSDALPGSFLTSHASEMAAWRSSGRKAILRYAYNRGAATTDNDATLTRILAHIAQLGPLWHEYQDVIAVLQAGFIGRWGEWNQSSSGNLTKANRNAVIDALLAAAPETLTISLRKPLWHYDRWPTPLSPADAWNGSPQSRAGMMNDSFVANAGHAGTYYDGDGMTFAQMRAYWAALAPYTVYGGETSDAGGGLNAANDGAAAIAEMEAYQLDYLNSEYWTGTAEAPGITRKWQSSGHLTTISRRLGYRLALEQVELPTTLTPGSSFNVKLTVRNDGFGKVFKPRPIDLVLVPASGPQLTMRLTNDARSDLPPGGGTRILQYVAALPESAAGGEYAAHLRLPDPSPHLAPDSRYAIRLANNGLWDAAAGRNSLQANVTVVELEEDEYPLLLGVASKSNSYELYPITPPTTVGTYYVATSGSDSNNGSLGAPFKTITKALSVCTGGETILVRGGVHTPTSRININQAFTSTVRLWAYGTERPILDGSSLGSGSAGRIIYLQSASRRLHIKGFEIRNGKDSGIEVEGQNLFFEDIVIHDTLGTGLHQFGGANNLYQDVVCFALGDGISTDTNVPDAIALTHSSSSVWTSSNKLIRCLAFNCPDDGFDHFRARGTEALDCVAVASGRYHNGNVGADGNGFKEGGNPSGGAGGSGGNNTFKGCLALYCKGAGFDDNNSIVGNSVSFCTGAYNTHGFQNGQDTCTDNISYGNTSTQRYTPSGTRNSWNLGNQDPKFEPDFSLGASSPYRAADAQGMPTGASDVAIGLYTRWKDHSRIWIPGRGLGPGGTGLPGDA